LEKSPSNGTNVARAPNKAQKTTQSTICHRLERARATPGAIHSAVGRTSRSKLRDWPARAIVTTHNVTSSAALRPNPEVLVVADIIE
jgi:hypothetical protein